jgi:ferredoxin
MEQAGGTPPARGAQSAMANVTFLSMSLPRAITVSVPDRNRSTLLSLARRYGVPLRCSCGQRGCDTCASCAVKVAPVRATRKSAMHLDSDEREALRRAGKLTAAQSRARALVTSSPFWRLACRYVPGGDDVWVAF